MVILPLFVRCSILDLYTSSHSIHTTLPDCTLQTRLHQLSRKSSTLDMRTMMETYKANIQVGWVPHSKTPESIISGLIPLGSFKLHEWKGADDGSGQLQVAVLGHVTLVSIRCFVSSRSVVLSSKHLFITSPSLAMPGVLFDNLDDLSFFSDVYIALFSKGSDVRIAHSL